MLRRHMLLCFLVILAWFSGFADNNPLPAVPPAEANARLIKRVEPIYPIAAKDARIGGRLRMAIVITANGDVSSAKLVSGYPMPALVQSATNAVKQWKYKPFEQNGKPVAVTTQVDVVFPAGGFGGQTDAQIQAEHNFYTQADKCHIALKESNYSVAEAECKQAVALSNNLPKDRVAERAGVLSSLANALLGQHRAEEAVPLYEQALALDKTTLKPDSALVAADYWRLAVVYAATKDVAKADQYYNAAVTTWENAIQEWPFMKPQYTERLKETLLEYAKLKRAEKEKDAAAELQSKAEALQP
jgi:TonB family protein